MYTRGMDKSHQQQFSYGKIIVAVVAIILGVLVTQKVITPQQAEEIKEVVEGIEQPAEVQCVALDCGSNGCIGVQTDEGLKIIPISDPNAEPEEEETDTDTDTDT